ncbi:STEROL DESATURASE [Salix koriyanagi]|uniref:STEROL DESATURASE n=1 Tax=Salix koriyanagi TaxID=2511006 RepID=A0A9Q0U5T0_9ROSI|nr:STEROL DESATURASE [Salix koriyanagi]
MAARPGILTDWPWKPLGSFKHVILVPWVVQNIYSFMVKDEKDLSSFLIFPILLWRALHNQLWISLSRYRTAKGNNRIIDRGIEFDQVDRESSWDDQILFNGILCSDSYGSGGVSVLLASSTSSSPLSLLSLSFPSPFLHCHRAHYFCDSSIRRAHILLRAICNPNDNDYYDGDSLCNMHSYLHRLDEQHGSLQL